MKVMVFHIGRERYGLPLSQVVRALPVAQLTALPHAPHYIPGLLDLHSEPVPVIDLSRLAGMTPAAVRYDTRILLVDYRTPDGAAHTLGLKCERVSGIAAIEDGCTRPSGVDAAPFLGKVASTTHGMLQLVDVDALLPAEVRALLFQKEAA